jgi:hypothetical protein
MTYASDEPTLEKLFYLIDKDERGWITPIDAFGVLELIKSYSEPKIDVESTRDHSRYKLSPFMTSPFMKRLDALSKIRPPETHISRLDFMEVMAMTVSADN